MAKREHGFSKEQLERSFWASVEKRDFGIACLRVRQWRELRDETMSQGDVDTVADVIVRDVEATGDVAALGPYVVTPSRMRGFIPSSLLTRH